MNQEQYWYWLCNIEGVWRGKITALLERFGTPEEIFAAREQDYAGIKGIDDRDIANIIGSKDKNILNKKFQYMVNRGITFLSKEHEEYPIELKHLADAPYGIFVRGDYKRLFHTLEYSVAVVGARNSSAYGKKIAADIGFELANYGITVVSGMARGIDSEAAKGALEAGGDTIAVLGCGVDVCYPRENIDLYEQIVSNGLVMSEYMCRTQPYAWQFPFRNRLISGMVNKVIVVEAKEKSGSLITAEFALEQGKDVLAVPGRIGDALSVGCNRLIKEGAEIVTNVEDIVKDYSCIRIRNHNSSFEKNNNVLEKDLEMVYSCVDLFPKSLAEISSETGIPGSELLGKLMRLQLMGFIDEPSTQYYSKKL